MKGKKKLKNWGFRINKSCEKGIRTCIQVSSQSWPNRMRTRRSSSARMAWSTAHPEWRCGSRYDIVFRRPSSLHSLPSFFSRAQKGLKINQQIYMKEKWIICAPAKKYTTCSRWNFTSNIFDRWMKRTVMIKTWESQLTAPVLARNGTRFPSILDLVLQLFASRPILFFQNQKKEKENSNRDKIILMWINIETNKNSILATACVSID